MRKIQRLSRFCIYFIAIIKNSLKSVVYNNECIVYILCIHSVQLFQQETPLHKKSTTSISHYSLSYFIIRMIEFEKKERIWIERLKWLHFIIQSTYNIFQWCILLLSQIFNFLSIFIFQHLPFGRSIFFFCAR